MKSISRLQRMISLGMLRELVCFCCRDLPSSADGYVISAREVDHLWGPEEDLAAGFSGIGVLLLNDLASQSRWIRLFRPQT
jgi:hypothetical protein